MILWIALGATLFGSFIVSVTDGAVSAFDRAERRRLSEDPATRDIVRRLDLPGVDSTLNIADLLSTAAATAVVLAMAHEQPFGEVWLLLLAPAMVLGPKATGQALGASNHLAFARLIALPLWLIHGLLTPFRVPVDILVRVCVRLFGIDTTKRPEGAREAEILALVAEGAQTGMVAERERDIVEAVFDFGELTVGRLMTPRPDMFAVPIDAPWEDLLVKCREAGFSRVPVIQRRSEEIVGVLLLKDLLRQRATAVKNPSLAALRPLLVPPTYVPQSKPANQMLREFLVRNQHMAFVVDEHGTLVGLVTLDDLLRELVGEFLDQTDDPDETALTVSAPGQWLAKAWIDLDDLQEETGIDLPRDGYNTLGGFVFHELGRLPFKGDTVTFGPYRMIVTAMEGRRIAELALNRVTQLPQEHA